MCLVDKKQFRYAEKDIPIFKVAVKCPDGKIISPFLRTDLWKVNNITENQVNDCNRIKSFNLLSRYQFDEGFFHAFTDKGSAIIRASSIKKCCSFEHSDYEVIVVTGYIPEGTRYAIDIWEIEICARKMILNI